MTTRLLAFRLVRLFGLGIERVGQKSFILISSLPFSTWIPGTFEGNRIVQANCAYSSSPAPARTSSSMRSSVSYVRVSIRILKWRIQNKTVKPNNSVSPSKDQNMYRSILKVHLWQMICPNILWSTFDKPNNQTSWSCSRDKKSWNSMKSHENQAMVRE